ncbi:PPE family protein [Tsukamurella pseudospumae]|uniref:PPE domain-containing protein n=1 Tax=Tsukamurella pseudospumae TaxID=239498 RepID=A0A137ZA71_9ACTN|nr:PPE family protein [Tsukamurella pseudospumae]KXO95092.1 hypothetical protein AXK61_23775 [Tsukamurella pseudospumae]
MTFPALPPEVNVGRLMTGAGPAPAAAASAAWATVAGSVSARSAFLLGLLTRLAAAWQAPETLLMTRNVATYLAYNEVVRVQALVASTRHAKQAADYSSALAEMAQIPEITTNHVTNATLHATNFLGVNTAPIAANEAQYAGMWAQNSGSMFVYLANTTLNMSFDPFLPPKPLAAPSAVSVHPLAAGAATAAEAAVEDVALAAQGAAAVASTLSMRTSAGVLAGTQLGQTVGVNSYARSDQGATNAKNAEGRSPDEPSRASSGKQLGQQLIQQLGSQGPQMAMQGLQTLVQIPQQAVQAGAQVGQTVMQPLSQIMSSIDKDHRTERVGYFGTQPGSPSLERLAQGSPVGSGAGAVRGLGGLTQYAAPSKWLTGGLTVPPPAPTMPRVPIEPMRTPQPMASNAPVARSTGRKREPVVVAATATMPVYQDSAPELDSVPIGAPAGGEES